MDRKEWLAAVIIIAIILLAAFLGRPSGLILNIGALAEALCPAYRCPPWGVG